jgi:NTE family protein
MKKNKKIALVIGWGGVKCAAALGLLRVLNEEGIDIDLVVGSGAGSIFASFLALGYTDIESEALLKRLWSNETTRKTNKLVILQMAFPKLFGIKETYHIKDDKLINKGIFKAFGEKQFKDTRIPLLVTATDYRKGEQVILAKGSIAEAVRASIALPLIFKPIIKDDKLLVDGFLTSPIPIGVAIKESADIILAMGFDTKKQMPFNSFSNLLINMVGILSNNLLHASISFFSLAHHDEVISVVPDLADDIHLFDTERVPEIIAAGEKEAKKHLAYIKKLIEDKNG